MKTLLPSAMLALLITSSAFAQSQTPPPFPGWANKSAATAATNDRTDLVGKWEGFVTDGDGSNPGQRRMNVSLTITADRITSDDHGNMTGEGTYKISRSAGKLRQIDATGTSGQYQGKLYEGVFALDGNTLKWCSGNPGKGRPTALRTDPMAGHFLMVLTRKQ